MRTVGVKLIAEMASYKREVRESANETRDFVGELKQASRQGEVTAKATETFGRNALTAARHVDNLDGEIEAVKHDLRGLAVALAEAGSAAERLDLSRAIRRTEADLTRLKKAKGLISGLIPGDADTDKAGRNFATRLAASIGSGMASASAMLGAHAGPTVGVGIGVAAAPVLLSTMSAALSAGAGAGVLGLGILALVKGDAEIQAAGKAAGQKFMTGLQNESKVLRGPVLESLNILSAAGDRLNANLGATFQALSGEITPFTAKVVGAGEAVEGSLLAAARKSGPALDGLGDSIGLLADGTAKFIDGVSKGGPQAAENMRLLAASIGDTIAVTGKLLGTVSQMSDNPIFTGLFGKLLKDGYGSLVKETDKAAAAQTNLTPALLSAGEAAGKAGMQMQTYGAMMNDAAAKGRGLFDSQTDVAQAMADASKAAKENGKTLDVNSQKGRDNRRALSAVAAGLKDNYDAYVKVNGEGRAASGVAAANRASFVRLAGQFGVSRRAAESLATQMGLIPAKKNTNFYANTHDAAARLDALRGKIASVHGKTVEVHVSVTGTERLNALGHRIGGAAAGGPVEGPGTTTSDSIPMMLSRGEHVWTAREVAAAGGQGAVAALRAAVLGGARYAAGGAVPRVMPASAGMQKLVVEVRTVADFRGAGDAMARGLISVLRTQPGVRVTMAKTLAGTSS